MILDTHDNLHRYAGIFRDVDPQPLFDWLKTLPRCSARAENRLCRRQPFRQNAAAGHWFARCILVG
ncbi:MAG: hypothetical protein ACKOEG_02470, partial [Chthoniobacterales bacterium]